MADDERPLADEALRLLGSLQGWVRENFPAGPDGHMGAECQWCPLCQFMAVLRGERPEVTARVAEAGAALTSAIRAVVESAAPKPADPAAPRVQHIDLGTDDPGNDDPGNDDPGTDDLGRPGGADPERP